MIYSLTCKLVLATWYGSSSFVGGGHPSWPLEVTGNSGFFKLVHCGNFETVISSNPYALCASGDVSLAFLLHYLSFPSLKLAWPGKPVIVSFYF